MSGNHDKLALRKIRLAGKGNQNFIHEGKDAQEREQQQDGGVHDIEYADFLFHFYLLIRRDPVRR